MSPLSAIPPTMSAYGIQPRAGVESAELPGMQAPLPLDRPGEITPGQPSGDSFGSIFGQLISDANAKQNAAVEAVTGLQGGQNVSLHQAVIAMEEANVSFQLMVEVRNKLLESYQEMMRMQI